MKKSIISILVAIAVMCGLFCIATPAASNKKSNTKTYALPLATKAPQIDGTLDDAAWKGNTLTVTFSSISDIVENGGYVKNSTKQTGATSVMKAVWSNESSKEGLYFCWEVKDATQSWAADETSTAFNAMDAAQVVLDPLNLKFATAKNCAMCFTFTAYTSASGNGMCPTKGAAWFEHWIWASNQADIGVVVKSTTNARPDTVKTAGIDRVYLLDEYKIEAYIPVKAMNVNNREPELKVGAEMGVGFTLIDYDWKAETYAANKDDIPASQDLINMYTDFGNGKDRFNYPKFYNTMVLTDESGVLPSESQNGDDPQKPGQEGGETTQAYADSAEAYAALKAELDTAKSITDNEKIATFYKEDGIKTLKDNADAAKDLTDANTVEELAAAITNVKNARLALESTKTLKELFDEVKALDGADSNPEMQTALADAEPFTSSTETDDAEGLWNARHNLIKILAENDNDKAEENQDNQNGTATPETSNDSEGFPVWAIVLIIVAAVIIIAVIVVVVMKKKNSKPAEASEEAPAETESEEKENTDNE